jgi:hypothetical protein
MEINQPQNKRKILLALSISTIATVAFWVAANMFDIYQFAALGAIFEILWLPMMLVTFALPVTAIIFWYRDGYRLKSWFLPIGIVTAGLVAFYVTR